MVGLGPDPKGGAAGGNGLGHQGRALFATGAAALFHKGVAEVVLGHRPLHRVVGLGPDPKGGAVGGNGPGQQGRALLAAGAAALIPEGDGEVVLSSCPEVRCAFLRQVIERPPVHVSRQRQPRPAIAQPVGIEAVFVSQPPPRRFQPVDAAEAVGGGGQDIVGVLHPPTQQGVGGAGFLGFCGDLSFHLVDPGQQFLDLIEIQPLGGIPRRAFQIANRRHARVEPFDPVAVVAVFLGFLGQEVPQLRVA